jgi:ABC-type glycerol-3-phosphate transport system permease component
VDYLRFTHISGTHVLRDYGNGAEVLAPDPYPGQICLCLSGTSQVRAGLTDNAAAIVLPHIASAFAILNLIQSFKSYPVTIIDAARIDGASGLAILLRVILPSMMPIVSSLGILLFITSWNDYLWPRLVIRHIEYAPIQIGLRSFISSDTNLWGSLMAATTVSCIPVFLLYAALQRKIVDSFVKWGMK